VRMTGGAGLGLAITERAVRFLGGKVSAANRRGGGLVVEIRLPLIAALSSQPLALSSQVLGVGR